MNRRMSTALKAMTRRPRRVAGLAVAITTLAIVVACGSESPTAPDSRPGVYGLLLLCDDSGSSPLVCRAETFCTGSPGCSAVRGDVTAVAEWSGSSNLRVVGPGRFEASGVGDGNVHVVDRVSTGSSNERTVSVFPGTAPLPTTHIQGTVVEAGRPSADAEIPDASIEVLTGPLAGRQAQSGVLPSYTPPGFFSCAVSAPFTKGRFCFQGVPSGTIRLRVSAAGYVTQDVEVAVAVIALPPRVVVSLRRLP